MEATGLGATGCWFFTEDEPNYSSSWILATESDAFLAPNGAALVRDVVEGSAKIYYEAWTTYSDGGYEVTLSDIGEPERTGIESLVRSATMMVDTPTLGTFELTGYLWCGV